MVAFECCTVGKDGFFVGWNCVWAEWVVFGFNGSFGQDDSLGSDTKYDG